MVKDSRHISVLMLLLVVVLCGCDSEFSLELIPDENYTTAVNTYTTIAVSSSGDVNDPNELPNVTIESVEIEDDSILTATIRNDINRVLLFAENPGRTDVTIHTDLGSKTLEITAVVSDGMALSVVGGIEIPLPQPSTWLQGGEEDIGFVCTFSGAELAGGNLSLLESSDEELISIFPAYSLEYYPDSNVATLQFNQIGTGIVRTIDGDFEFPFEIVEDIAIASVVPAFLATEESIVPGGNMDETALRVDTGAYDWWRVIAYDTNSLRVGGLYNQLEIALDNSPGCDFDFIFDEFALYRETPGECVVHITIGSYEESITYTYH